MKAGIYLGKEKGIMMYLLETFIQVYAELMLRYLCMDLIQDIRLQ